MRGTHVAREKFRFEGGRFTLFKRGAAEANWEIDFIRDGERHQLSLETPVKAKALARAKGYIERVKAARWTGETLAPRVARAPRVCCSAGALLEGYEREAGELAASTVRGARSSLRIILRTGLGIAEELVDRQSCEVFAAKLVRDFQAAVLRRIETEAEGEDVDEESADERAQRAKRTANSYLNQARGVFTPRMVKRLEEAGLVLPEREALRGFMEEPLFARTGKSQYNAPADEVIQRTFASLSSLRIEDESAYLAICLACGTGMRKSEVRDARWSWFRVGPDGTARVKSSVKTKNGDFIDLPVLEEWWERIAEVRREAFARGVTESSFVIPGTLTERKEDVFRRIGAWMRGLGWETQKTFHEFRAYVASMIAMDPQYGFDTASLFLRHHSVDFTRRYYLRYVQLRKSI